MSLYSSEKILLDTQKFDYYDEGGCATIYKCDDILLKIYNEECKKRHYIKKSMFQLIKNSDIPNMVKLLDLYYKYNRTITRLGTMDAYTLEIVKGKRINLLEQKRDYLKDMIDKFESTIDKLVELKVIIEDPTSHNIIFTENGPTIIDPDQFIRVPFLSPKTLYELNKEKIIIYLNKTIDAKKETESARYIFCGFNSSLTRDFNNFLEEETINETIQKKVYKSI